MWAVVAVFHIFTTSPRLAALVHPETFRAVKEAPSQAMVFLQEQGAFDDLQREILENDVNFRTKDGDHLIHYILALPQRVKTGQLPF